MAARTTTLSNTLLDASLAPRVGVAVRVWIASPGNAPVVDVDGHVEQAGPSNALTTTTDNTGHWSVSVVFPGDLTTANCLIAVQEGTITTLSPIGFAYSSTITVASWYPAPATVAGTVLMRVVLDTAALAAAQGVPLRSGITATAVTPGGVVLSAATQTPLSTDSGGAATIAQVPSSLLNPPTTAYSITFPDRTTYFYTAPVNPTGWQGAYNNATAYHVHDGTAYNGPYTPGLTPPDVVSSGGVYYVAIADTTGNAPPNATYWAVWPGENLLWHLTVTLTAGAIVAALNSLAHTTNAPAIAGDAVGSPTTLDDDIHNLAGRTRALSVVAKSTTYSMAAGDDVVEVTASSGWTLTLPPTAAYGRPYRVVKTDNNANAITIAATSGAVHGTTSLASQYAHATYICDGTNWYAF